MTETTSERMKAANPNPSDLLMNVVINLFAPMFLGITGGDIGLARRAAIETVNDYRIQNQSDLVAVAQIVAFGLAALGSLSLSMADDLSLSITLRLRGNAVACNRSAEQNRRALARSQANRPMPEYAAVEPEPETTVAPFENASQPEPSVLLTSAAEHLLAAESQARLGDAERTGQRLRPPSSAQTAHLAAKQQDVWVAAKEAGKSNLGIPYLPPTDTKPVSMRATAMSSCSNNLLSGDVASRMKPDAIGGLSRPNQSGKPPRA